MEMTDKPLISVLVAAYNVQDYIERCIYSIIGQSYDNLEIIVVNDGSTDCTLEFCHKIKDDRLKIVSQENSGLVNARKTALRLATGKYVSFIDGDDYIENNMYEEMQKSIGDAEILNTGILWGRDSLERKPLFIGEYVFHNMDDRIGFLVDNIFMSATGIKMFPSACINLYDSNIAKKCYMGIPDGQSYGEDLILFMNAILECKKIISIDKCFYHYEMRSSSITHDTIRNITNEIQLLQILRNMLYSKYCANEWIDNVINSELIRRLAVKINDISDEQRIVPIYKKTNIEIYADKKIVIYGAGSVGQDYYMQLSRYQKCDVVAWVDRNYKKYNYSYYEVKNYQEINNHEFDYVIIAILDKRIADAIVDDLVNIGIPKEKIIWEEPELFYDFIADGEKSIE